MEDIDYMGENASEMINKLSRQLEHSRDLNELFTQTSHIKNCLETLKNKGNLAY